MSVIQAPPPPPPANQEVMVERVTESTSEKLNNNNEANMSDNKQQIRKFRIVLLGKPGCGKGTHGKFIAEQQDIPIISTGDEIRALLKSTSEDKAGLRAKLVSHTSTGTLVPDNLVIDILKNRISKPDCEKGYILDGFPRTVAQAEALDTIGEHIDLVVHLQVENEIIMKRMTGRWSCPECGRVYNVNSNDLALQPGKNNTCKNVKCNNVSLIQRSDDKPEIVENRLKVYEEQTAPVIDYYKEIGKLSDLDVSGPRAEVTKQISQLVEDKVNELSKNDAKLSNENVKSESDTKQ